MPNRSNYENGKDVNSFWCVQNEFLFVLMPPFNNTQENFLHSSWVQPLPPAAPMLNPLLSCCGVNTDC